MLILLLVLHFCNDLQVINRYTHKAFDDISTINSSTTALET